MQMCDYNRSVKTIWINDVWEKILSRDSFAFFPQSFCDNLWIRSKNNEEALERLKRVKVYINIFSHHISERLLYQHQLSASTLCIFLEIVHTKSNDFTLIITEFVRRMRSFSFAKWCWKLILSLAHKIHGIRWKYNNFWDFASSLHVDEMLKFFPND